MNREAIIKNIAEMREVNHNEVRAVIEHLFDEIIPEYNRPHDFEAFDFEAFLSSASSTCKICDRLQNDTIHDSIL